MIALVVALLIVGINAINLFPPNNQYIQYTGRVDRSNPDLFSFDWASVHIYVEITKTTTLSLQLQDSINVGPSYWGNVIHYDVYVDGIYVLQLNSSSSNVTTHVLAQGLTPTQHSVMIARRNEPSYGTSGFVGIILDDGGQLVSPPPRPDWRIEFLGDSITCGWGTEGLGPCSDQPQVENSESTWATLAAKAVGADYSVVSWSGQGMVRYYGCPNITCPGALPSLYNRTLGQFAEPAWDFSSWIPQAVIINLVTNDYGSKPNPPTDVFVAGYTNFVMNQVIPVYGKNVTIFACDFFGGIEADSVKAASGNLTSLGVNSIFVDFSVVHGSPNVGCDGHPNVATQTAWANYLAPIIKTKLGW